MRPRRRLSCARYCTRRSRCAEGSPVWAGPGRGHTPGWLRGRLGAEPRAAHAARARLLCCGRTAARLRLARHGACRSCCRTPPASAATSCWSGEAGLRRLAAHARLPCARLPCRSAAEGVWEACLRCEERGGLTGAPGCHPPCRRLPRSPVAVRAPWLPTAESGGETPSWCTACSRCTWSRRARAGRTPQLQPQLRRRGGGLGSARSLTCLAWPAG
jgi:hypothetical protein